MLEPKLDDMSHGRANYGGGGDFGWTHSSLMSVPPEVSEILQLKPLSGHTDRIWH